MLPDMPLQPVSVDVKAANGSPIVIEGCIDLSFSVGQKLHAIILVSSDITEFMLVIDWLMENNVNWKFGDSKLELHGQIIPLMKRPSKVGVRRIFVRENVTIPPNTAANVPVKLVGSTFRHYTSDWLVNTKVLTDKVFVARVVLPDQDEHAAVQVVNLSKKPYILKEGITLGSAQAATVLDHQDEPVTDKKNTDHLKPVIESLPMSMPTAERKEAIKLIKAYHDVFSRSEYDLGCTSLLEQRIEMGDARPFRQALRRHPQVHLDVID